MSEPWGFRVQLSALENFANTVNETLQEYRKVNGPLATATVSEHDANFDKLLGQSRLPGSTAVNDECRNVMSSYSSLYERVARAQSVIEAQLNVIATNVTDTHQLYSDVEGSHETIFRGMSKEFASLAESSDGGDNGSAGPR